MFQHTFMFMFAIATVGAVTSVLYTASYPFYFLFRLIGLWPGKTPRSQQIGSMLHKLSGSWVLWMAGIRVHISKENQKKIDAFERRNVVFCFGHESNCDPFICTSVLPANVRFVYKEELKYVPFLGCGLVMAGHIAVDRGAKDKAINSLHRAEAQLLMKPSEGGSFALAPEGTRSRDGKMKFPFKKGPFMVARNTGATIVPLMLTGAHSIFPPGSSKLRPGVVSVKCLDPVDPVKFKDADTLREAVEKQYQAVVDPKTWEEGELAKTADLPISSNPLFALGFIALLFASVWWMFFMK